MDKKKAAMMCPSKQPFPTFIVVFAYRHEYWVEFLMRVLNTYFSPYTTIRLALCLKVYDDKKYQVQLMERMSDTGGGCSVSFDTGLLCTDEVTDMKITLPGEALFWGNIFKHGDARDYVLELESLRYILNSDEHGPEP
jgi:hypothetical protein